jgi:hypothetical protein
MWRTAPNLLPNQRKTGADSGGSGDASKIANGALRAVRRHLSAQNIITTHGDDGQAKFWPYLLRRRALNAEIPPARGPLHRAADSNRGFTSRDRRPLDLAVRTRPQPSPRHGEHIGATSFTPDNANRRPERFAACSAQADAMTKLMPAGPSPVRPFRHRWPQFAYVPRPNRAAGQNCLRAIVGTGWRV